MQATFYRQWHRKTGSELEQGQGVGHRPSALGNACEARCYPGQTVEERVLSVCAPSLEVLKDPGQPELGAANPQQGWQ